MTDAFAIFARTFIIGIAVAAPVGAIGVLCIQRTLSRGWRYGMITGLGVATADGIYAAMAAFGVSVMSTVLVTWQTPLRIAGGFVLIGLGLRAALAPARARDRKRLDAASDSAVAPASAPASASNVCPLDAAGAARSYVSAVGLTLTNPMTIMAFGAIFAGAGLNAQSGVATAAIATIGVASGSLMWWTILVSGVALARHAVGQRMLAGINIVSGAVVALFGVLAVASVLVG